MSKYLFNLSCPRCDTAVKIYLKKTDYQCSRCHFRIFVNDPRNLLVDYSNGKIDDLDIREAVVNEFVDGVRREGLSLSFNEKTDDAEESQEEFNVNLMAKTNVDDGKSAHTQVINLSFDPAQILEEYTSTNTAKEKKKKKRLSLKRAISNASHSRAPVATNGRTYAIAGVILCIITLIILIIIAF